MPEEVDTEYCVWDSCAKCRYPEDDCCHACIILDEDLREKKLQQQKRMREAIGIE